LEAVTHLLKALPSDFGMAVVLIQHLDPTHESAMAVLLSRATLMPVVEARHRLKVEPGHVYIIPPNKKMGISRGVLRVMTRDTDHRLPSAVDFFFHELAVDSGVRAIGIILSGTGVDGTHGIQEIKSAGGVTFAQDESSAKYSGMPVSASSTGCIDHVLSPEAIAAELVRMEKAQSSVLAIGDESGLTPAESDYFMQICSLKFGLLAENSTEVFWFLNLDPLHFTYISPSFERIWGVPVEEMLADHTRWIQSLHPEDRASVTRQFYDWVEGTAESFVCDYRIIRRDDEVRWISTRGSALPAQPGQPRHLGGVARDITHRKKTEEELRQSGRFALSTLEAVPAALAVLDEEGMILSSNESWNALVLAGAGAFHHCAPGTNYLQACAEVAGDGRDAPAACFTVCNYRHTCAEAAVDSGDAPLRLADGIRDVINGIRSRFVMEFSAGVGEDRRWFVTHVTAMRGAGPRRVVVSHLDITLRKQAEKGIRRMNDELECRVGERTRELQAANEVLQREMAARLRLEEEILEISESERQRIGQDLHDDLGQQVAGAVFLSQALATELTLHSSPAAQSASRLMETLQRALDLTRTLARGLHPVAMEVGGLSYALSELVEKTSQLFGNRCEFFCPQPVSDFDNTQATHLYRIAQESVTNAVKHGQASRIAVSLTETPLTLVLSIRDNGAGLSHPAPKAEGMGLRIMRYRADIIGGDLTLASSPSGGTTVTCTLPRLSKSN
jgi:PAS domain S-box-containing protein